MKLYELNILEDGSAKVESELSPEEMKTMLTMGLLFCLERGVMLKSLAHHFLPIETDKQPEETNEEEVKDWESKL